ncbi:alpha/beta hydrolase [Arthrobacter gandavensis]|uniref:alpha/beta fold hydrolase n=1 Tax=Arthrobacter gandavensis TaxID=169960 RepID=UPI00188F75F1|nr:alpha/beta hydrolase [Arthrobacter gandavensis]MBF4995259.1 alpha/beta hydrolase [Arthrobacter gandavensis]
MLLRRRAAGTGAPAPFQRRANVRTVAVQGTAQRFWDFPAASPDTAGPAVFMVHGFRGDHHGLLRLVEALPNNRVILPDLPGFGQAAALPGTHDAAAYAGFVRAGFEALGLGADTVLLGHSFGSIIAARTAAANPELISELILVNPISEPALKGPKAFTSKLAELYYLAAASLPEKPGRALLANPLIVRGMSVLMAKTRDPALRHWIHGQHDAYFSAFASRAVVLEAFRSSISETVRDSAALLKMPVLLVAADRDDIGSVPAQCRLAELVPDSELEILTGVGHLVHYEAPDSAAALITDFLSRRHRAA